MADCSKATVLVIDDYTMNLKITEFVLQEKYNVITADSGAKALEILGSNKVDLILLDIVMPEMDGFETYSKLRNIEGCANIPVCFLTADEDDETVAKVNSLGLSIIQKPFDPSKLASTIGSIIE